MTWCWMRMVSSSYSLSGPQYQLRDDASEPCHSSGLHMPPGPPEQNPEAAGMGRDSGFIFPYPSSSSSSSPKTPTTEIMRTHHHGLVSFFFFLPHPFPHPLPILFSRPTFPP